MNVLRSRKGFTLIEMLVVVLIIAILVAIAIPALFQAVLGARTRACAGNIRNIESAAALFASNNDGNYPAHYGALTGSVAPDYFPDADPACPFGTAYTLGADGVVPKAAHFGANFPNTHL